MAPDIIQANYEELEQVAARFAQAAAGTTQLRQKVQRAYAPLERGGWQGRGADAFAAEMRGTVLPALERMVRALEAGRAVTLEIKGVMRRAEEEAAAPFKRAGEIGVVGGGGRSGGGGASGSWGEPGTGGTRQALDVGPAGQLTPLSPWATAPFAAGASVFGPGPVPIWGPRGKIPRGYTGYGLPNSRLWLYFGGRGSDTVFSIHRRAGWGRAPLDRSLAKPFLRFDYGVIDVGSNKAVPSRAYLPNGREVMVPRQGNFFHWNQQGGMGQINRPLWQSIGGAVRHDHQLLTNNPAPRANVFGRIPGGTLVRGASRGLFVVGAGMDVYNIATAEDKARESIKVASGWAGGWAGAKGGAAVGATVGTFFGPGLGTAIGGVVGGIAGGIGGYLGGSSLAEWGYDKASQ